MHSVRAAILAASLALLPAASAHAQAIEAWVQRYKEPGWRAALDPAVAVDASGNVIVIGHLVVGSSGVYATVKYSSAGIPLWTNLGPAGRGRAVAVDGSGDVYVTGGSSSSCATIKYSNAGLPLWTNRYNAPGMVDSSAQAIAVDASGNVVVTGEARQFTTGGLMTADYLTIKYSSAGVLLWAKTYDDPLGKTDSACALAVDADGNVYVTGRSADGAGGIDWATVKYVTPPIITRQPLSCTNAVGTAAGFGVEVAGGLPLGCQWRRAGTNLVDGGSVSGVTTTNLLIANVQLADAVAYTVVVTNACGSATSHVAQLTVVVPPNAGRLSHFAYSPVTGFNFIFCDAAVGQPYRIQRSPSLAEGSWTDWMTFTYTEPFVFTDLGVAGAEQRFYRAVSP